MGENDDLSMDIRGFNSSCVDPGHWIPPSNRNLDDEAVERDRLIAIMQRRQEFFEEQRKKYLKELIFVRQEVSNFFLYS